MTDSLLTDTLVLFGLFVFIVLFAGKGFKTAVREGVEDALRKGRHR